jgi:STE24 endopeptidase
MDNLGTSLVESTLAGALYLGLFAVFRAFPDTWLLWSLLPVVAFIGVAYLLMPVIVRLRFRSAPIDHPEVEEAVRDVFARAGVPLVKVSLWKLAGKTRRANAGLVPRGRSFEVLVSDTLISSVHARGVRVAVAHELGHLVHRDTRRSVLMLVTQFAAVLLATGALFGLVGSSFGLRGPADIATLPVLLLAFTLVSSVGQVVTNALKRRSEFAADRFALDITKDPDGFVDLMTTLAKDNLSDTDVPRWIEVWLHDHPSIAQRIAAARAWAASPANASKTA